MVWGVEKEGTVGKGRGGGGWSYVMDGYKNDEVISAVWYCLLLWQKIYFRSRRWCGSRRRRGRRGRMNGSETMDG